MINDQTQPKNQMRLKNLVRNVSFSRLVAITALAALSVFVVTFVLTTSISAQQLPIKNGDFSEWSDGKPVGWDVAVSVNNGGDQPLSVVREGSNSSLELSGDRNTRAWQSVSQSFPVKGGRSYRIRFSAKTNGLQTLGNQYENCYVGVLQKHERGQVLRREIRHQNSPEYLENSIVVRTHNFAASATLTILLTNSGTLNVKAVSVEELKPKDSFKILCDELNRSYSYFEHKKIDWPALTQKYRPQLADCDADTFVDIAATMLAEVKDTHIWLEHRRNRVSKYVPQFEKNYDFDFIEQDLKKGRSFGTFGITALTSDGFGYVRISSLAVEPNTAEKLIADLQNRLLPTKGIILDLRRNPGGAEKIAFSVANLFASEETIYGRSKFRASIDHTDFYEGTPRVLEPTKNSSTKPVICLIGPGTVSSAEAFAMMMKAIPTATVIGQPTRGASGKPEPIQLPNGVDVWFSRWCSMLPDGTLIEDDGVPPDETIVHGEGDPTYIRAVEILKNSKK